MDGASVCRPGSHGPTACGTPEDALQGAGECTCGCDAFGTCCPEQQLWWQEQQRQADQQAGRKSRWEDLP